MLNNVFARDPWAITPERMNDDEKSKPDFVIEKLEGNKLTLYIICEIKKRGSQDHLYKALDQAVRDIQVMVEGTKEVYIIIKRGLDIGFFEYNIDEEGLDMEEAKHFKLCVSLTQDRLKGGAIVSSKTPSLKTLLPASVKVKSDDLEKEAKKYDTPCIFNLDDHKKEIDNIFLHILNNKPRATPE